MRSRHWLLQFGNRIEKLGLTRGALPQIIDLFTVNFCQRLDDELFFPADFRAANDLREQTAHDRFERTAIIGAHPFREFEKRFTDCRSFADQCFNWPNAFRVALLQRGKNRGEGGLVSKRNPHPRTNVDSNNDGIINDRPLLNGSVVRRNMYRNYGFADTSTRVQKAFALPHEKGRLSVSGELFNLFNFANVEIGSAQMTYGPNLTVPSTNPLFGKVKDASGNYIIGSTLRTTPFQVQLGLRLEF